jgi:thiol-disulfide isomerase/thioredoxin
MLFLYLALSSLITITPLDEDGMENLIAENLGSVLVINFWATWCGPCRDEFPDLIRVYEENKDQGLIMASVSMDEPEDRDAAIEFLQEQGATFPSYIRDFEDFPDFVSRVDPDWTGVLPVTFIFDQKGKRVLTHLGIINYDELSGKVDQLLNVGN